MSLSGTTKTCLKGADADADADADPITEAALESDLQSLIRVRNRLAMTSDDKLPRVLSNLLPRLLQRFDRTNAAYVLETAAAATTAAALTTTTTPHCCSRSLSLLEQQMRQYTGILAHVMDRIRLVKTGEFCKTLMPVLQSFHIGSSSSSTITMALSLLQTGLPYYYHDYHKYYHRRPSCCPRLFDAPMKDHLACDELDLTPLILLVHETHQALHHHQGVEDGDDALPATDALVHNPRLMSPLSSSLPKTTQMLYRMSGSLLLEAMALTFRLTPLDNYHNWGRDADQDHADDDGITSNAVATMVSWDELHHLSTKHTQTLDLRLDGVFHLVLDILLYLPSTAAPVRPNRNDNIIIPDNFTGLSTEALGRLNHRQINNSWNSNIVQLRMLKFVTLTYALGNVSASSTVFSKRDNDVAPNGNGAEILEQRKQILAVLAASTDSMDGRLATKYVSRNPQHPFSFYCSLSLAANLLILVLGDRAASETLQSHDAERQIWEPILGSKKNIATKDPRLVRSPLPFHFAERAVNFVRENLHLLSLNPTGELQNQILLVADLVMAIQNTERYGVFWGIHLMSKIYSEVKVDGSSDNWRRRFYQHCLVTALSVLSVLPDRAESHYRATPHMEQHPLGVPEPFGRRRDLEMLVNNHRKTQKNRFLQRSDAISARKVAYDLVAELAPEEATCSADTGPLLDMCMRVFKWVSFEEEANQTSLSKALDSLLITFVTSGNRKESDFQENAVFSLIPYLLVAACSESSNARLLSLQWSSQLVDTVEPMVARHICSFLSNDLHDLVSKQAKLILGKLKLPPILSPPRASVCDTVFLDARLLEDRSAIANDLKSLVEPIQCEFGLEASSALAILLDHDFNKQAVKDSLRKDKTSTLTASGLGFRCGIEVTLDEDSMTPTSFSCGICYDDDLDTSESFALPCQHVFCRTCWVSFLKDRLAVRLTADRVCCPQHDCDERVLLCDIAKIQAEQVPHWYDVLLDSFVEKSDRYSKCPGPGCSMLAFRSKQSKTDPVSCPNCTALYCFECRHRPHEPAACHHLNHWIRIYSSSKFWIQKNTKPCPACKVPIEKNDGCNHMDCSQCGTAFCWLCLSILRTHMEAHSCNSYDPLQSAGNDSERRALFYTERFKAHEDAEEFTQRRLKHFDDDGDSVAERLWYLSGDQLNQLYEATESLADARRFLQYSYVAAWAMQSVNPHAARFTQVQATLENVTERLSYMAFQNLEPVYRDEGPGGVTSHFRTMGFFTASNMFMHRMSLIVQKHDLKRDDDDDRAEDSMTLG